MAGVFRISFQVCFSFLFITVDIFGRHYKAHGLYIDEGYFNENKYSNAETVDTKEDIGPKMCIRECSRINACTAVNYFRSELKCEFLNVDFPQPLLQTKRGSFYTEIERWQMVC